MKNILLMLAAIFSVALLATTAEAKNYHRNSYHHEHLENHKYTTRRDRYHSGRIRFRSAGGVGTYKSTRHHAFSRQTYDYRANRGIGGRPSAWCGWYMRTIFGGGAEYNLARNWARRGSPTSPHAGAVVVWPHHVGVIVGPCSGGRCLVKSGNYANRVAVAMMRVSNAIAFRNM